MVRAEGKKEPFLSPRVIEPKLLECFDYQLKELDIKGKLPPQLVTYKTTEFSAVCPFSGLPDLGTIIIEYLPNKKVLELKSLKYYLLSYRQVGIYQEHVTQKLFADLQQALKPQQLKIITIYNTRGGIDTTCEISS